MLLPLQGENAVVYSLPRAPLRSALGYEQVAPAGRTDGIIPPMITTQQGIDGIIPPMITTQQGTDGIIPPIISTQPNWFFRAKNDLSSYQRILWFFVQLRSPLCKSQENLRCENRKYIAGEVIGPTPKSVFFKKIF